MKIYLFLLLSISSFRNQKVSGNETLYIPALPETLPYAGTIVGPFDYVPQEPLLAKLRQWLRSKGVASVYYFLTERVAQDHPTDYEISISELTEANFAALNNGFENVVAGTDFSWALFMGHEGQLHVAGPRELFSCLQAWDKVTGSPGQGQT